jgi:hypothetical protein
MIRGPDRGDSAVPRRLIADSLQELEDYEAVKSFRRQG